MSLVSPVDESAILTLYEQILANWNKQNAAGMSALFQAEASVVGFDGSVMNSAAEIGATMARIFADHKTGTYVGKVRSIRFLGPEVALLQAVAGVVPHGQPDLNPALNTVQSLVAVRESGEWRIALYQNTPAQFHGRPEEVEALTTELRQVLRP